MLRSYIKYEARNCMYGKRCGGLPSRNFGGLAKRGRSRYHSSRRHRLGAHGVRRSDLVTRQSPLRMKCGTARFWYWARVNVGPYTIIASHITSLTTMPKYPLNRITSRSTARPASQWPMSRATPIAMPIRAMSCHSSARRPFCKPHRPRAAAQADHRPADRL